MKKTSLPELKITLAGTVTKLNGSSQAVILVNPRLEFHISFEGAPATHVPQPQVIPLAEEHIGTFYTGSAKPDFDPDLAADEIIEDLKQTITFDISVDKDLT